MNCLTKTIFNVIFYVTQSQSNIIIIFFSNFHFFISIAFDSCFFSISRFYRDIFPFSFMLSTIQQFLLLLLMNGNFAFSFMKKKKRRNNRKHCSSSNAQLKLSGIQFELDSFFLYLFRFAFMSPVPQLSFCTIT